MKSIFYIEANNASDEAEYFYNEATNASNEADYFYIEANNASDEAKCFYSEVTNASNKSQNFNKEVVLETILKPKKLFVFRNFKSGRVKNGKLPIKDKYTRLIEYKKTLKIDFYGSSF